MSFSEILGPLVATRQRREVLTALTAAYMLVQLSSLPVALSLPSIAEYFGTEIDDAAWIVVVYLMVLGSLVLLAARLGDMYGHVRVFFIGIAVATLSACLLTVAGELWHLIAIRGVAGVGSAMIMGNANAILAITFPPRRARARLRHSHHRCEGGHTDRTDHVRRVPPLRWLASRVRGARAPGGGGDGGLGAYVQAPGRDGQVHGPSRGGLDRGDGAGGRRGGFHAVGSTPPRGREVVRLIGRT